MVGKRLREAAIVAATLLAAIIALRMSARNPGDLSALDRGILAVVSPAQAASPAATSSSRRSGPRTTRWCARTSGCAPS
jgi:hypothetical protein